MTEADRGKRATQAKAEQPVSHRDEVRDFRKRAVQGSGSLQ
ncbi:MAG TPA: hypothetical protein VJ994_06505 [Paracoccaceae bacterium]|nr:hypothetical protein [Paracoccaceae bacterium]